MRIRLVDGSIKGRFGLVRVARATTCPRAMENGRPGTRRRGFDGPKADYPEYPRVDIGLNTRRKAHACETDFITQYLCWTYKSGGYAVADRPSPPPPPRSSRRPIRAALSTECVYFFPGRNNGPGRRGERRRTTCTRRLRPVPYVLPFTYDHTSPGVSANDRSGGTSRIEQDFSPTPVRRFRFRVVTRAFRFQFSRGVF